MRVDSGRVGQSLEKDALRELKEIWSTTILKIFQITVSESNSSVLALLVDAASAASDALALNERSRVLNLLKAIDLDSCRSTASAFIGSGTMNLHDLSL